MSANLVAQRIPVWAAISRDIYRLVGFSMCPFASPRGILEEAENFKINPLFPPIYHLRSDHPVHICSFKKSNFRRQRFV
jgi:hypothetical protein